jgi:hypothetical protein
MARPRRHRHRRRASHQCLRAESLRRTRTRFRTKSLKVFIAAISRRILSLRSSPLAIHPHHRRLAVVAETGSVTRCSYRKPPPGWQHAADRIVSLPGSCLTILRDLFLRAVRASKARGGEHRSSVSTESFTALGAEKAAAHQSRSTDVRLSLSAVPVRFWKSASRQREFRPAIVANRQLNRPECFGPCDVLGATYFQCVINKYAACRNFMRIHLALA